jgi:4'-phosphopantetheinyl transferase
MTTALSVAAARPRAGDTCLGEVRVWLLAEADVPRVVRRLGGWRVLSPGERERLLRLRTPGARRRHLGSRLLCRTVLARYAGVEPVSLRFTTGPFGRLDLDPNPWRLRFNLSHTAGLIAGVFTVDRPCGIDVERGEADPSVVRHGIERLAPAERARLSTMDPRRRAAAFVDTWVLKEAYTKALGFGFQHHFDSFTLSAEAGLADPSRPAAELPRWQFELATTPTGHRLAVAVRREPTDQPRLAMHLNDFAATAFDDEGARP